MRRELLDSIRLQNDGFFVVKARTRRQEIIVNEIRPDALQLDVDFTDRQGTPKTGRVLLVPVAPKVTRIDTIPGLTRVRQQYLAALNCYTGRSTEALIKKAVSDSDEEVGGFMRDRIIATGHEAILEFGGGPTFLIEGVGRPQTHQEVRHRHRDYAQRSQRYQDPVKAIVGYQAPVEAIIESQGERRAKVNFVVPNSFRADQQDLDFYVSKAANCVRDYCQARARGIPAEDARNLFNQSIETRIVIGANPRAWRHVIDQRTCALAQAEIDITTTEIAKQLWQEDLLLVVDSGPHCARNNGQCKEGKRSCGLPIREPIEKVFAETEPGDDYPHDWYFRD